MKTGLIRGKSSKFPLWIYANKNSQRCYLCSEENAGKLFEFTHKHECFIAIFMKYILIAKEYPSWSKASEKITELLAHPRQDDKRLTLEEVVTSGGLVDRLKYIASRVDRLELSHINHMVDILHYIDQQTHPLVLICDPKETKVVPISSMTLFKIFSTKCT